MSAGLLRREAVAGARTLQDLTTIAAARGYKRGWIYKAAPELGIPTVRPR